MGWVETGGAILTRKLEMGLYGRGAESTNDGLDAEKVR